MSKTFRPTIAVLVLLAGGGLVTGCRSSSDKDQSKGAAETAHSKVDRAHAPRTEGVASLAGEPTHASSKATHAQAKTHANAEPGSKESSRPGGKPAQIDPLNMTP
jgi:hypothetical protein